MNQQIIGLDLSLNGSGIAVLTPAKLALSTLRPPREYGAEARLKWIASTVMETARKAHAVVLEGLSLGSFGRGSDQLAGLHWMVRCMLNDREVRYFVCPPTSLKLFVAGKGNAPKSVMLREVYRLWKVEAEDDNQADAAALAHLGKCLVGLSRPNTAQQRRVLEIITKGGSK